MGQPPTLLRNVRNKNREASTRVSEGGRWFLTTTSKHRKGQHFMQGQVEVSSQDSTAGDTWDDEKADR